MVLGVGVDSSFDGKSGNVSFVIGQIDHSALFYFISESQKSRLIK